MNKIPKDYNSDTRQRLPEKVQIQKNFILSKNSKKSKK